MSEVVRRGVLGRLGVALGQAVIGVYRFGFAWLFGGRCRYMPSCSCYAQQAVGKHGLSVGFLLGFLRVCRCGPGGGYGFDPVPAVWQDALPVWVKKLIKLNS